MDWERERCEEKERRMMRSFYPETARAIHPRVAEECDRLNYPGSFLFDEYPDKRRIEQVCRRVRRALKTDPDCDGRMLDELIRVLVIQEMLLRRSRSRYLP